MAARRLIHKIWAGLADILFPRTCFACGAPHSYFCDHCASGFTPQSYRLDNGMPVYAALPYRHEGVGNALKQLKYRGSRDIASALAELLANALPPRVVLRNQKRTTLGGNPYGDTEIVAVPITTKRSRGRGFNQAELLGRALAAQLNLPFADALEKIRETPPQSTLKRRERLMNLRGAFRARPDYRPAKTVLVVDDISTTGATLIEAARALKKAGARTVIGAVVAKA